MQCAIFSHNSFLLFFISLNKKGYTREQLVQTISTIAKNYHVHIVGPMWLTKEVCTKVICTDSVKISLEMEITPKYKIFTLLKKCGLDTPLTAMTTVAPILLKTETDSL